MTRIRIKGFQIFTDRHGKKRCYHRSTRHKIDLEKTPLGSAEFVVECDKIAAIAKEQNPQAPKPGTMGGLIESYFGMEHFQNLAVSTKRDYRKCADFLHAISDYPVSRVNTPFVAKVHNTAAKKIGWRRANMVRTFISQVFKYNIPEGLIDKNFAEDVIPKPRPKNAKRANRPWSYSEVQTVLNAASPQMRAVLGLIHCTGLDPTDALGLRRDQIDGGIIWKSRDKTSQRAAIPIGPTLRTELGRAPNHDAITVLANSKGSPWTYDGFQSNFQRLKKRLEQEGTVQPGLTPQGLRHTMATWLREAGMDERAISDILAQKTPAMGLHYSRDANLAKKNQETVNIWEEENKRRSKFVKPNK